MLEETINSATLIHVSRLAMLLACGLVTLSAVKNALPGLVFATFVMEVSISLLIMTRRVNFALHHCNRT